MTFQHVHIPGFITQAPPMQWAHNYVRKVSATILSTGAVPEHVALIMDGNRRYAKNKGMPTRNGHEAGSLSLLEIVDVCMQLEIKHLSIYAFSIENFNRSKEEVDLLFELLVEKLNTFLNRSDDLNHCVRVRIIGNRSLVPEATMEKLCEIEELTKKNNKLVLNVNFAYTSRDEIAHSMEKITEQVANHETTTKQIDEKLFAENFYYSPDTPPINLLIRTSGHTRLSDYLNWQVCENTEIVFLNVYWPDFTSFHFYAVLVKYGFNRTLQQHLRVVQNKLLSYYGEDEKDAVDIHDLPTPPPFVSVLGSK